MSFVCRVCLSSDLSLRTVQKELIIVYTKLTNNEFCSEDPRPRCVCCFCYQKLLKCYTFSKTAQRSEQIFNRLLFNGVCEVTRGSIAELHLDLKQQFSTSPMQYTDLNSNIIDYSYHVKEELYSVKELQISAKEDPLSVKEECVDIEVEPVFDVTLMEVDTKNELFFEAESNESEQTVKYQCKLNKTFECNCCSKTFGTKTKLKRHINYNHTTVSVELKKHCRKKSTKVDFENMQNCKIKEVCSVCKKMFNFKSHLAVHMRIHTGDKPFRCTVCNKTFNRKWHLADHISTHTGEKPYACTECSKSFRRKSNLIDHKRLHTGEKPFNCSVCNTSFRQKSGLRTHFRIHTGEKPFACSECGTAFSQSTQLNRHLTHHTKTK